MTAGNSPPLETSPLLPKDADILPESGSAPERGFPSSTDTIGHTNASTKPQDEERQDDEEDREVQYKGMPDVRKKLKYILPTLAVGVYIPSKPEKEESAKQ